MRYLLSVVVSLLFFLLSPSITSATTIFFDTFDGSDGTKLSEHDSKWTFTSFEPGTSRWGEYKLFAGTASDGDGTVYNSNRLNVPLSSHFRILENFSYNSSVSNNPNLAFLDIRLMNVAETGQYLFRFSVNQPQSGITLQTYGLVSLSTTLGYYNPSGENLLEVEYNLGLLSAKINGTEVLAFSDSSITPDHLFLVQTRYSPTAFVNSFEVIDLSSPTPTPTASPSATPSPSPTLITAFSQRDPNWNEETYDSANLWSSSNPTIERWGCALTSASTVLDYYGIHELPGGVPNNPKNLNDWLNNESDGYIRKGAINWNAISRVSKLLSSPDGTPALEYAYKGNDSQYLHERLSASQPVILEEPGHFITAYRYDEGTNTTDIVDPYWTTGVGAKTTLASYADTFKSMRTFSPSHTNLGYLMGISDSEINMKLLMKHGPLFEEISTAAVYTQEPFVEQSSGNTANASPFNALEYPKPEAGNYQMSFSRSAPGYGRSEIYIYDSQGNPEVIPLLNLFGTNNILFNIQYDPEGSSAMIQKVATFDLLRQDLLTGRSLGEFKKNYRGQDLLEILEAASRVYPKWKKPSLTLMSVFTRLLPYRRRLMSAELYDTLVSDAELLITQLY